MESDNRTEHEVLKELVLRALRIAPALETVISQDIIAIPTPNFGPPQPLSEAIRDFRKSTMRAARWLALNEEP